MKKLSPGFVSVQLTNNTPANLAPNRWICAVRWQNSLGTFIFQTENGKFLDELEAATEVFLNRIPSFLTREAAALHTATLNAPLNTPPVVATRRNVLRLTDGTWAICDRSETDNGGEWSYIQKCWILPLVHLDFSGRTPYDVESVLKNIDKATRRPVGEARTFEKSADDEELFVTTFARI